MNEYRETWHGLASEETMQALLTASSASIGQTKIVDTDGHEAQVTESGELKVSGSGPNSNLTPTHWSPADGAVTYLSTNTLTCTGWPFTVDNTVCAVLSISLTRANGEVVTYESGLDGVSIGASANVITLTQSGSPLTVLVSTDTAYRVAVSQQVKAYDPTVDVQKVIEQSPDRMAYVQDSIVDATNTAAATTYYPSATGMAMDGASAMSLTGKFITTGTLTLTVEASNDEDTTNADWVQVYGYDNKNDSFVNLLTLTNTTLTFALMFNGFNYANYRLKVVDSSSTNTYIIKSRKVY